MALCWHLQKKRPGADVVTYPNPHWLAFEEEIEHGNPTGRLRVVARVVGHGLQSADPLPQEADRAEVEFANVSALLDLKTMVVTISGKLQHAGAASSACQAAFVYTEYFEIPKDGDGNRLPVKAVISCALAGVSVTDDSDTVTQQQSPGFEIAYWGVC